MKTQGETDTNELREGVVPASVRHLEALARELSAWNGQRNTAIDILARLRELLEQQGRLPPELAAVRKLAKLAREWRVESPSDLARKWPTEEPLKSWAGVLLADDKLADWKSVLAFDRVSEDLLTDSRQPTTEVVAVLRILATGPVIEEGLVFISEFFLARPRVLWMEASQALARLAERDDDLHMALTSAYLWLRGQQGSASELHPKSARWVGSDVRRQTHAKRHFLHLEWLLAAVGRPLGAASLEVLLRRQVDLNGRDPADVSVEAVALGEALRAGRVPLDPLLCRSAVMAHCGFLGEGKVNHQNLAAVAGLASNCERWPELQDDAVASLFRPSPQLLRPNEHSFGPVLEVALGWLAALEALLHTQSFSSWHQRQRAPISHQVTGLVPFLRQALTLALAGPQPSEPKDEALSEDACSRLVGQLNILAPDVFVTSSVTIRVSAVATIIGLIRLEELKRVAWGAVLRRAGLADDFAFGERGCTVAEAGLTDVTCRLIRLGADCPSFLLHRLRETPEAILGLLRAACIRGGSSSNEFFEIQAAVLCAKLLNRRMGEPASLPGFQRVDLLWNLLRENPGERFWSELRSQIRSPENPAKAVLDAIQSLRAEVSDQAVHAKLSPSDVFRPLRFFSNPATEMALATLNDPELRELLVRHDAVAGMSLGSWEYGARSGNHDAPREWLRAFSLFLAGAPITGDATPTTGTLVHWLGRASLTEMGLLLEVTSQLSGLVTHFAGAAEMHSVTRDDCNQLAKSLEHLLGTLDDAGLPWPEHAMVVAALAPFQAWLEATQKCLDEDQEVRELLDEGNPDVVIGHLFSGSAMLGLQVRAEVARRLSPKTIRATVTLLLHQLRLSHAQWLSDWCRGARPDVPELPTVGAYYGPLWAGVLAGAFFTVSLGKTWNDIAEAGGGQFMATIVLGYGVTLLLLAAEMRNRLFVPHGTPPWRTVARRVVPLFAAAMGVALVESLLLLWLCADTETAQMPVRKAGERYSLASVEGVRVAAVWTGVSLFGGVFLGLVAQGRRVSAEDN